MEQNPKQFQRSTESLIKSPLSSDFSSRIPVLFQSKNCSTSGIPTRATSSSIPINVKSKSILASYSDWPDSDRSDSSDKSERSLKLRKREGTFNLSDEPKHTKLFQTCESIVKNIAYIVKPKGSSQGSSHGLNEVEQSEPKGRPERKVIRVEAQETFKLPRKSSSFNQLQSKCSGSKADELPAVNPIYNLAYKASLNRRRRFERTHDDERTRSPVKLRTEREHPNKERNFSISSLGSSGSIHVTPVKKCESLEHDESLGILTPNQMEDFPSTPSTNELKTFLSIDEHEDISKDDSIDESLGLLSSQKLENLGFSPYAPKEYKPGLSSQDSILDNRSKDPRISGVSEKTQILSLPVNFGEMIDADGSLLEDVIMDNNSLISNNATNFDTTVNLELSLDKNWNSNECPRSNHGRVEQTPSPEDLPLDPVGLKLEERLQSHGMVNQEDVPDANQDNAKSKYITKSSNSFVISITSVTSLDTGYQGDGEASRPASRVGDHSPTNQKILNNSTQRPVERPVTRRPDPMTDSDFFTESEADENGHSRLNGDRRVQVIDGHLYGINPPVHGEEVFVNQNQVTEMESSGIFTDVDANTRADDIDEKDEYDDEKMDVEKETKVCEVLETKPLSDQSPSDISSQTVTENSQQPQSGMTTNASSPTLTRIEVINSPKMMAIISPRVADLHDQSESGRSSPSSLSMKSPKYSKDASKKYAKPKKCVPSKVKTMLETTSKMENQENRKPMQRKVAGNKWDAIMSKISDNKSCKPNLKDVKSKVFTGTSLEHVNKKEAVLSPSNLNKTLSGTIKTKRRIRNRAYENGSQTGLAKDTGSAHSSLSDISNSGSHSFRIPSKATSLQCLNYGSAKKNGDALIQRTLTSQDHHNIKNRSLNRNVVSPASIRVNNRLQQSFGKKPVSTTNVANNNNCLNNKHSSSNQQITTCNNNNNNQCNVYKRQASSSLRKCSPNTSIDTSSVASLKSSTPSPTSAIHSSKDTRLHNAPVSTKIDRLAVNRSVSPIVAHSTPSRDSRFTQTDVAYGEFERKYKEAQSGFEALTVVINSLLVKYDAYDMPELKRKMARTQAERDKYLANFAAIKDQVRETEETLNNIHKQHLDKLISEYNCKIENYREQLTVANETYQQHKQQLEAELKSIRDENERLSRSLKEHMEKSAVELKRKLASVNDEKNSLRKEFENERKDLLERLAASEETVVHLKEDSKKIMETLKSDNKLQAALARNAQLQDETESLRSVLEMKTQQCADLRIKYEKVVIDANELPAAQTKIQSLQTRVEDLEIQLDRKEGLEKQLRKENKFLQDSIRQEAEQNKRLSYQMEEYRYKLKQNAEALDVIIHSSNGAISPAHLAQLTPTITDTPKATPTRSCFSRSMRAAPASSTSRSPTFRERLSTMDGDGGHPRSLELFDSTLVSSPPNSPKVKGVIAKSDSVSYILEMDESTEALANRMLRRSFRQSRTCMSNSTPVRAKKRTNLNPLSASASETSIGDDRAKIVKQRATSQPNDKRMRSKSMNAKSCDQKAKNVMVVDDGVDQSNNTLDFRNDLMSCSIEEIAKSEYSMCGQRHASDIEVDLSSDDMAIDDLKNVHSEENFEELINLEHSVNLPALPSELERSAKNGVDLLQTFALPSGPVAKLPLRFESNSEDDDESSTTTSASSSSCEQSPIRETPDLLLCKKTIVN